MSENELAKDHLVFPAEDLPDDFDLIQHLATKASIPLQYEDVTKLRQDHQIPEDFVLAGQSYSMAEVSFKFYQPNSLKSKRVTMTTDEYSKKYIVTRPTDCYCIVRKEVAYWRKFYDLSEAMEEAVNDTLSRSMQNCAFYPLNDAMWNALAKHDQDTYERLADCKDDPNIVIAYHEWY